jgi:hypothetical protein
VLGWSWCFTVSLRLLLENVKIKRENYLDLRIELLINSAAILLFEDALIFTSDSEMSFGVRASSFNWWIQEVIVEYSSISSGEIFPSFNFEISIKRNRLNATFFGTSGSVMIFPSSPVVRTPPRLPLQHIFVSYPILGRIS